VFTQGQSGNVNGRPSGKEQVETKATPPDNRDIKAKDARSTVGQWDTLCSVSQIFSIAPCKYMTKVL
jgi:hypothetical protein